jgi:hypothetical protein
MSSTNSNTKKIASNIVFLIAMFLSVNSANINFSNSAFADDAAATTDTASINETQKQIFGEAKRAASEDQNTRNSLLMIAGVLCVVGFAMYLAFKSDDGEKKQTFARTPKKDF